MTAFGRMTLIGQFSVVGAGSLDRAERGHNRLNWRFGPEGPRSAFADVA